MEDWKYKMRIFLTGGTGFIGKYILKHLKKEGYNILLLTRASKENISPIGKNYQYLL